MTQQIQEIVSTAQIAAAIESVLFVSGRPLECAELRKLLDIDEATLIEGLQGLAQQLESQGRGIRLQLEPHAPVPEHARIVAQEERAGQLPVAQVDPGTYRVNVTITGCQSSCIWAGLRISWMGRP